MAKHLVHCNGPSGETLDRASRTSADRSDGMVIILATAQSECCTSDVHACRSTSMHKWHLCMQIKLSFMFHPGHKGISIHIFVPGRCVEVPVETYQNNIGPFALHPAKRAQMAWPLDMLLDNAQGPARGTQSFRERIAIIMVSGKIW